MWSDRCLSGDRLSSIGYPPVQEALIRSPVHTACYLLVTKALRLGGTMLSGPGAEDVQMASGEGRKKSSVSRPPQ